MQNTALNQLLQKKRSPEEIKGAIHLISGLVQDIDGALEQALNENDVEELEVLIESNSHYSSVLLTLLWSYGKITDEELLFGKLPKRLA
jgi:hypothetical protein